MKRLSILLVAIAILVLSACSGTNSSTVSSAADDAVSTSTAAAPESTGLEPEPEPGADTSSQEPTLDAESAAEDPGPTVEVIMPPEMVVGLGVTEESTDEFCETAGFYTAEFLEDGSLQVTMSEERRDMLLYNSATGTVIGLADNWIEKGLYGLVGADFDYYASTLNLYVATGTYEDGGLNDLMIRAIPDQAIKEVAMLEGHVKWDVNIIDSETGETIDSYVSEYTYTPTSTTSDASSTVGTDPTVSTGQANALRAAKNYIDLMPFSYSGLIEQLEFEGYTTEEATYGADNCGADWNEQAAEKAADYLSVMSFSRESLISQLEFEGFTHDQAVYGAEQNGY